MRLPFLWGDQRSGHRGIWGVLTDPPFHGPVITLALALGLSLLARVDLPVQYPAPLFLTAIVYSAAFGRLRSAFLSVVITLLHYLVYFSSPDRLFHYSPENFQRLTVMAVAAPIIAATVGTLTQRIAVLRQEQTRRVLAEAEVEHQRRLQTALESAYQELDHRVADRTAELERLNLELQRESAERLRIAAALDESQQRLRLLFASNPLPTWVIDRETHAFLEVNDAAVRQYGYTREEFLQRHIADILPPQADASADSPGSPAQIGGMVGGRRHQRRDGSIVDVEILSIPLPFLGRPAELVVAADVTRRKQNEEAIRRTKEEADRANAAKSQFLSRMSHELRTPLNAIIGFAQLLELESPTPRHRTRVEHILSAGRHLLQLINEVLDLTRIESGKLTLSVEPVPLASALQDALDLIQPLADQRAISLERHRPTWESGWVRADHQRLKQVLLNLLANAIKYNQSGGTVAIACEATQPDWLRISIIDTGPGIPADRLDDLFQPFERLDAEQSNVEGTGLGLPLSKGLVEAMGGRIGVTSTVGAGSTFWVELPLAEPRAVAPTGAECVSMAPLPEPTRRRTVLYIEDNPSNLKLIEDILSQRPHMRLVAAIQGRLGLTLAREHHPDVILLDVHLPDISGLDVLLRFKADPQLSAIPVVVVSADATPTQIDRLLNAGAYTYLTKPLDVQKFLATLDTLLV